MAETLNDEKEKANWHPGEEGRLTKDEAHDDANMMKVELKRNPNTGVIYNPSSHQHERYEATTENFEEAFVVIEKLKQAAKDESTYQKVEAQILRAATAPVRGLLAGLDAVSGISIDSFIKWKEHRTHWFEDAEKRLKDMKKAGKEFGKSEFYSHPNTPQEK